MQVLKASITESITDLLKQETKDKKARQKLFDAAKAELNNEDDDEPLLLSHFGIPQVKIKGTLKATSF